MVGNSVEKKDLLCLEADCHFFGHGTVKDYEKAIYFYNAALTKGSTKAALALGRMFEEGLGHQQDMSEAKRLYLEVAENEPLANYNLGRMYEEGNDPDGNGEPDLKAALTHYDYAMTQGCPEANVKMANLYMKGIEGQMEPDLSTARALLEGMQDPNPEAVNFLGQLSYQEEKYKEAFEYFKKGTESGCINSMNNLGTCYELGHGCEKDLQEAFDLYTISATKGNIQAMANLGFLYFKKGRLSNSHEQYLEAAHWFRFSLAEDSAQTDPNYYIGLMYKNGLGVDRCYTFAYKHLKRSADLGHANACSECGDLMYAGKGCQRPDKTRAYEWYEKGSELGSAKCMNSQALMLESDYTIQDPKKSVELYARAAELGNSDSVLNLGILFQNGAMHVDQNYQLAIKLMRKAARLGNQKAMNHLIALKIVNNKNEFLSSEEEPLSVRDLIPESLLQP